MVIRRTLLSVMVCGLMANAYAATIEVNTFDDEDGENASACSLREAIKASDLSAAYGGCDAGKRSVRDVIQLEAGQYTLTRGELTPKVEVTIQGALRLDANVRDYITGDYPQRQALKSTITAAANARILNTGVTRAPVTMNALILKGGTAEDGGAIRAGSSINLSEVELYNATASRNGGAIYLEGTGSNLTLTNSLLSGNSAGAGAAVVGMSCLDNLKLNSRSVTLDRVSMINNGSSSSQSIVDLCGIPSVDITGITIAKNTTSTGTTAAVIRVLDDGKGTRLSTGAVIAAVGMTLVENNSPSALLYGDQGTFVFSNSILAFNSGKDCAYNGNQALADINNFNYSYLLVGGTSAAESCQIPPLSNNANEDLIIHANGTALSEVLHPLANYGGFLNGYLPKSGGSLSIIDKGGDDGQCGDTDQRGVNRSSGEACDIGALELGQLTANVEAPAPNESYKGTLDREVTTITDEERADLSAEDQKTLKRLEADLAEYQAEYKKVFKYRTAYISIFDNDLPYEQQIASNGYASSIIPLLPAKTGKYTVTTKSLGTGTEITDTSGVTVGTNPENVECTWNSTLGSIGIRRKDFKKTLSGFVERCEYTISYTDSTGKIVTSTSYAQSAIVNIKPIVEDAEFVLKYGQKTLSFNLLDYASDEGDGPQGIPLDASGKQFYLTEQDADGKDKLDANGQPIYRMKADANGNMVKVPAYYQFYTQPFGTPEQNVNIRIIEAPTQGRLTFERQGYCPDNSTTQVENICYGGKATYTSNNLYSPFNDSFTYVVLDNDKVVSNTAEVKIINTATTTEDTRNGNTVGGGSLGVLGLFGLVGMMLSRRRYLRGVGR